MKSSCRTSTFLLITLMICGVFPQELNAQVRFDTNKPEEFFYQIKTVNRINPDSAVVTIHFGKKDGLFAGATGNVMTSHNAGADASKEIASYVKSRESVAYIASATIIEISDTAAKASVKMYKKDRDVKILPGDMLAVETYPSINSTSNYFYELAKQDILFVDNNRTEIKTKRQILQNANPSFAADLLKSYTEEIKSFYNDLLAYTDSTFTAPYKTGPYKGMNMHEVFKNVNERDLQDFFHFVRKYPGKYMGYRWKINETFATWVLNNAPQGERNREWLIPEIQKESETTLPAFAKKYQFMITADSLASWTAQISELQTEQRLSEAEDLSDRLIIVAQSLKDKKAENEFYYTRSFILDSKGETRSALKDALKAYNADKKSINYTYNLASLYGKLEDFDNCFKLYDDLLKVLPGNGNVQGNYGWYKLTAGKVDDAIPYCKAAYLSDPGSVSFTVNYGHTFLLKGNIDSAKYYYQKTLDNLSSPTDYTTGPRTDFDLFFKKGWSRKALAEMADWMENEFNEKYYAITKGNELWAAGKKEYEKKNYQQAIITWKNYLKLYNGVKEPPLSSIHAAHNWIGSSYSRSKMYDSALYHYDKAMRIARDQLVSERDANTDKDNDLLVGDYERLYNLSVTSGNMLEAERYKMLYEAEAEKVTELFSNPALHLIVVNAENPDTKQHEAAAASFFAQFSKLRKENPGYVQHIKGKQLTRDKLVAQLEEVRKRSKPEDIFIFYYAGNMTADKDIATINFNEKDSLQGNIGITEFMDNIGLIYAHKKMIITDLPSSPLLSLITSRYVNTGRNAAEVIYLSPGIVTPVQENGISLFTNQLVNTLTDLQKNEKFSAKDFVDKASFTLGRGQYYFPVLSFSFGKDFLLYESKTIVKTTAPQIATATTRGTDIVSKSDKNAEVSTGPQKNYALLFGTNVYKDAGFNKLSNPIHDVETIAKLLKEDFGFEVTVAKDVTLDEMETYLSDFRDSKNYGANDQLFIFFAGHGVYDEKSKMGYLVANDSKLKDPNYKSYLSYSDLGNKYLKNISCNRIFLMLDACFAGTFFDNNTVRGTAQDAEANAKNLAALQRMASNQHFYKGISSGAKQYVEDGKAGQHSPFASKFLSVLWNKAMNKSFVTADEIIGDIKSNPPGSTAVCEGKFHYSDPFSHFIFELKNTQKTSDIKTKELQ
ncbi:MAG TPA: caspase family protein [Chitinophagaceae bacterium]|nr:caspase family protein [Chitinophagaceae bacterium]